MTRVRDVARTVRSVVWRPLVAALVVGGAVFALGMQAASAGIVALAAGAVVVVVTRVDATPEPRPEPVVHHTDDGARGEVLELAWTMVGRDGRAGERALRRLRQAGARRVARHGLDLTDPDDAAAVTTLLGTRAHATLTRTQHPLPSVGDLTHTLGVLERLGATRARPADARPVAPTTAPTDAPTTAPADAPTPVTRPAPDPRSPR